MTPYLVMLVAHAGEQAGARAVGAAVGPRIVGVERLVLPLDLAAAVGEVQALALLGLPPLLLLGILEGARSVSAVLPDPGSGRRLTLGGTTSGARSAILGSRVLASSADPLTPIHVEELALELKPVTAGAQREHHRDGHSGADAEAQARLKHLVSSPSNLAASPLLQRLTATLRRDCDSKRKNSYKSPQTPATIAASAILNTYQ